MKFALKVESNVLNATVDSTRRCRQCGGRKRPVRRTSRRMRSAGRNSAASPKCHVIRYFTPRRAPQPVSIKFHPERIHQPRHLRNDVTGANPVEWQSVTRSVPKWRAVGLLELTKHPPEFTRSTPDVMTGPAELT